MYLNVYSLLHSYFYSFIRFERDLAIFSFSFNLFTAWFPFYPRLDQIIITITHLTLIS